MKKEDIKLGQLYRTDITYDPECILFSIADKILDTGYKGRRTGLDEQGKLHVNELAYIVYQDQSDWDDMDDTEKFNSEADHIANTWPVNNTDEFVEVLDYSELDSEKLQPCVAATITMHGFKIKSGSTSSLERLFDIIFI